MKKLIITEEDKKSILRLYINEDEIKQGNSTDPYQYKKVVTPDGVKYYYTKKGTQNWIEQKNKIGIDSIEKIIFPKTEKTKIEINPKDKKEYNAILIGGLDYRKGDYSLDGQVELFKRGFGGGKKVKGFRYNTPASIINSFLEENPFLPIFMFSAGCIKSYDLSSNKNVDPKKLFVIEPYAASESTKNVVNASISKGIPNKNVFVGNTIYRGKDIVSGASSSNANTHWDALTKVGEMKSYLS